ncbi:MAG: DUF6378 domain-containing protein [Rhodanobacter sp.]
MTDLPIPDAVSILIDAADTITERGKQRDKPSGERSMSRTVAAFNALYGTSLSETQGWQFMVLLKAARAVTGKPRMDDYIDQAAYSALAGESAARSTRSTSGNVRYTVIFPETPDPIDADAAKAAAEAMRQIKNHLDGASNPGRT